jgi:hypothetical protein
VGIAQDAAERDDAAMMLPLAPPCRPPANLRAIRKHNVHAYMDKNSRLTRTAAGSNGLLRVAGPG